MTNGIAPLRARTILFCGVALVATLAACGSDSESADTGADVTSSEPSGDDAAPPIDTATTGSGGSAITEDSAAVAPLTAEEICERLTLESVGSALGLDIGLAEPSTMDTPQCEYSYDSDGFESNLTVASMRPEDVGGLSGAAAYDYVIEINRMVAGDADVEEVTLDAGEAAIRITGPAMHLGVVQVGDRVITLIVSADDTSGAEVNALIAKMATALG